MAAASMSDLSVKQEPELTPQNRTAGPQNWVLDGPLPSRHQLGKLNNGSGDFLLFAQSNTSNNPWHSKNVISDPQNFVLDARRTCQPQLQKAWKSSSSHSAEDTTASIWLCTNGRAAKAPEPTLSFQTPKTWFWMVHYLPHLSFKGFNKTTAADAISVSFRKTGAASTPITTADTPKSNSRSKT